MELEDSIPSHVRTGGNTVLILLHVYASFQRLEQTVGKDSLRRTELVSHFVRGFNSISGMMDIVDVGDEEDLMQSKITGAFPTVDFIWQLPDQILAFTKLPNCCFFILGIDSPDTYKASLETISNRDTSPSRICLIRHSASDDGANDQEVGCQFQKISFDGLFVPRTKTNCSRLSYVDIVQKFSTSPPDQSEKPILFGARKVSNASTISTQAEDDRCVPQPKENDTSLKSTSPEDLASVISDYSSDLSYSTSKRKKRMESRRKEILAKKLDIGLLATVPCPREEPDRSPLPHDVPSQSLCLNFRALELHPQSSRETLQQILSFSVPFFCLSVFAWLWIFRETSLCYGLDCQIFSMPRMGLLQTWR